MQFISTVLGKSVLLGLKLLGRRGSALPGYIIERINPKFLKNAMSQLPQGVVIITGTNGKTTTTKMISDILEREGLRVLSNRTGSNFVRGVIAAVIEQSPWSGKLPFDIAIIEQDEAYAVHFAKAVAPRGVVVLNVSRDQMDRFGEIDTTAKLLAKVVSSTTGFVVLNANDARVSALAKETKLSVEYFGHAKELSSLYPSDDSWHGTTKYHSAGASYAEVVGFIGVTPVFRFGKAQRKVTLQLEGSHNALNVAAAVSALHAILPNVDDSRWLEHISHIEPAFGRGELLVVNDKSVRLQLVKNPSGFRHSLRLAEQGDFSCALVIINDDYADGRDVSWLWDVEFDALQQCSRVDVSGTRATDMAVRLKYAEIKVSAVVEDIATALDAILASEHNKVIVYCTYTSMLQARKFLSHKTTLKERGV